LGAKYIIKLLSPKNLSTDFKIEKNGTKPIVQLKESKNQITIEYSFPGFKINETTHIIKEKPRLFNRILIDATGSLAASGKPLLPSFNRYVQIPANYSYEVKTTKEQCQEFDNVDVIPAQLNLTDSGESLLKQPHIFEFDEALYKKEEPFPKENVEITGPYNIGETPALLVSIRPLQFIPAKKKIIGYGNITVNITFKPAEAKKIEPTRPKVSETLNSLLLNPSPKIESRLDLPEVPAKILRVRATKFLIIYDDNLKSSASKLLTWKQTIGLETEMVAISAIGNTVQQIKTYIRNKRSSLTSALRYVLLFGDISAIASEKITWNRAANGESNLGLPDYYYSDYYYSTQQDSTGSYSSFTSPWLAIGRIPVNTTAEADQVVNDIINYEKTPPPDPDYYKKITLAGYFQDNVSCPTHGSFDPKPFGYPTKCPWCNQALTLQDGEENRAFLQTVEELYNYLTSINKQVERIYVSNNPTNTNKFHNGDPVPQSVKSILLSDTTATTNLTNAVKTGRLYIGHRDHGGELGWSDPSFKTTNLNTITTNVPSIFFSVNCLTGSFGYSQDCFAETTLKIAAQAPSILAASDLSGTFLNDALIEAIFDSMYGGMLPSYPTGTTNPPTYTRLGDMLNYAKTYLPIARPGDYIKKESEIYHVIGDPTLEVWTQTPKIVVLNAMLRGQVLTVELSECPKEAVVTVWYQDSIAKPAFLTKVSAQNTHFTTTLELPKPNLHIPSKEKKHLLIYFKAPGYLLGEKNIPIAS
jgi:hypothetical protein